MSLPCLSQVYADEERTDKATRFCGLRQQAHKCLRQPLQQQRPGLSLPRL